MSEPLSPSYPVLPLRTIWYPLHVPLSFVSYALWAAAAGGTRRGHVGGRETARFARDGQALHVTCAPCRLRHPDLASAPVQFGSVGLEVRRDGDALGARLRERNVHPLTAATSWLAATERATLENLARELRAGIPETLYGAAHSPAQAFLLALAYRSWLLRHDDEVEAFRHFARARPDSVILLLDTYDTEAAAHPAREAFDRAPPVLVEVLDDGPGE